MRRTLLIESIAALRAQHENEAKARKELHRRARELDALGRQETAQTCYEELLQVEPGNAEAWVELGLLHLGAGRVEAAIEAIVRALRIQPCSARIHHAFGLAFESALNPAIAMSWYQSAIGVSGGSSDFQSVEEACRRIVTDSGKPTAHLMLGNVRMARHKIAAAITGYSEAFRAHQSIDGARNLAFAYELSPDPFQGSLYRGYACFLENRPDEALEILEALPLKLYSDPRFCKVLISCYLQRGHYEKAIHVYQQAILHHLDAEQLAVEIAAKLKFNGHAAHAEAFAGQALQTWPGNLTLKYLYHLALPRVYESEEEIQYYRRRFSDGLRGLISDTPLRTLAERTQALDAIGRFTNFDLPYQNEDDTGLQRSYGALVHRIMGSNFPEWTKRLDMPGDGGSKIRVGYVSAFLSHHSVGNMYLGWLRHRNRTRFEVFCYHLGERQDYVTSEYRLEADHFRQMGDGLGAVCKQILADQLHILDFLDIGMFPPATQIAATRLAPVQCCSWGHSVTSGVPT